MRVFLALFVLLGLTAPAIADDDGLDQCLTTAVQNLTIAQTADGVTYQTELQATLDAYSSCQGGCSTQYSACVASVTLLCGYDQDCIATNVPLICDPANSLCLGQCLQTSNNAMTFYYSEYEANLQDDADFYSQSVAQCYEQYPFLYSKRAGGVALGVARTAVMSIGSPIRAAAPVTGERQ